MSSSIPGVACQRTEMMQPQSVNRKFSIVSSQGLAIPLPETESSDLVMARPKVSIVT